MSSQSHPYPALNTFVGLNRLCGVVSGAAGVIGFLFAMASSDLQLGLISVFGGLGATVSFFASAELILLVLRAKAELTDIREYAAELSAFSVRKSDSVSADRSQSAAPTDESDQSQ